MSKKHKKNNIPVSAPPQYSSGELISEVHISKKRWPVLLAVTLIIITGFSFFYESAYGDRFYPGISIGGMPVGGQTFSDVMSHFDNEAKVLTDTGLRLNFIDGGTTKEVNIPMSATGLTPDKVFEYFSLGDWQETVLQAYQFGRTGPIWHRFRDQARLVAGKKFNLPATPYEEALRSLVSHELEDFLKKAKPAEFAVDKKGAVYISPEKIGESMNVEEIIDILKKKISSFDSSSENLKAETDIPPATAEALGPYLDFAKDLAKSTNLVFKYKGSVWKVKGRTLITWLTVKDDEGKIGVNSQKLESFLSKNIVPLIDNPPRNSRFEIQGGKLVEIIPGKSGNIVDVSKTMEKVEKIIPAFENSFSMTGNLMAALVLAATSDGNTNSAAQTGNIVIPVETIQEEPEVTKETVDLYNIKDLVGSTRTNFKGSSEDRINNITIGISKLNGRLIAPGEEFSSVAAIGYVTEADGYVKEYVIKDNRSIKQLGGGLCQLGTTLFRLGLNAGLPITERVPHSYVVRYYGPGLDATIYGPHPDLKFINDTGHYLLMQGRVDGNEAVLELYGQHDGRQVAISEPVLTNRIPAPPTRYIYTPDLAMGTQECSETPREGVTSDVAYRVALLNGEVREQNFNSVYKPWGTICLVGTRI